jgi:NADH-quinone oxidoreductase subunit N
LSNEHREMGSLCVSTETVYIILPEIVLGLMATLVYLGGAFLPKRRGWSWISAAGIVMAGVALLRQSATAEARAALEAGFLSGPLVVDQFAVTLRWAALAAGVVFIMLSAHTSEQGESSEFMGSLLLIVAGIMLLALADDLITFFVALELISIPTYVILFLGKGVGGLESGTKYFFLSVLSSAVLLYGFSFLYGAAGSARLSTIHGVLAAASPDSAMMIFARLALVLIFAGLGFRLTIVPFHFYAPDVYQGTTNPNAGLLAVVPKIAGLVALVRIAVVAMPGLERIGWQLALALAIVTMTLGNLLALWQTNVRRLLAYSSIAHAGYMLIGLAVSYAAAVGATEAAHFDGVGAALFYLLVYAAATTGAFATLTYLGGRERSIHSLDELAGLSQSHPKTAGLMALFMFSLMGLPPLAGFWGKFSLFTGALGVDAKNPDGSTLWPWFLALAIVGALNAAVAAAYYLRVVAVMYFRPSQVKLEAAGGLGAAWAMVVCALLVVGIGCYPGPSIDHANRASIAARRSLAAPAARLETAALEHQRGPSPPRRAAAEGPAVE